MSEEGNQSGLSREAEWTPNFPRLRAFDARWCAVERAVCGVMFLVMSLLVFAAVVSSVFANRGSWVHAVIFFGVMFVACMTRVTKDGEVQRSQRERVLRSIAISGVVTGLLVGAIRYYLEAFPGGLPQAPAFALCMMLWVALLGASITTYERSHLALEFGEKLWPKRYLHLVKAAGRGVTALACVFLLYLSLVAVNFRYELWEQGDRNADIVPGLAHMPLFGGDVSLPQWVVLVIIPYTFIAMTVRFAAQSYTAATRTGKPEEEQLPT